MKKIILSLLFLQNALFGAIVNQGGSSQSGNLELTGYYEIENGSLTLSAKASTVFSKGSKVRGKLGKSKLPNTINLNIDFSNLNFEQTDLHGAQFKRCIMSGSKLHQANVMNTLFEGCKGFTSRQIRDLTKRGAIVIEENIFDLAKACNLLKIKKMLESKTNLNDQNDEGMTPLMIAVENDCTNLVPFLIENNTNIATKNNQGETALHRAAFTRKPSMVKLLVQNKAALDDMNRNGLTPLHMAIYKNDKASVALLIKSGANVEMTAANSPILTATYYGYNDIVKLLLENGADAHAENENGVSAVSMAYEKSNIDLLIHFTKHGVFYDGCSRLMPSMYAVINDEEKMLQSLIDNDFDINLVDEEGNTALNKAVELRNESLVTLLLENGADTTIKNNKGHDALILSLVGDKINYSISKLLIEHGAPLNESYGNGFTVYLYCVSKGLLPAIEILTSAGADVTAKTNQGQSALHLCLNNNSTEVLQFLIDENYDIDCQDDSGMTPIMYASSNGMKDFVAVLLKNNANPLVKDKKGLTAYDYALRSKQSDIASSLLYAMNTATQEDL